MTERKAREFGEGPLSRVTNAIYWYLITELLFLVVTLPGLVPMMFLERGVGNAPLFALCLLPLGPAMSAAAFALRDRPRADAVTPATSFFRGYGMNWRDALMLWVPAVVIGTVMVTGSAAVGTGGVPAWYGGVLVALGACLILWWLNALVILSLFGFRSRDTARLGVYYIFAKPLATLGCLAILVCAGAVVFLVSDVMLLLVAVLALGSLLLVQTPMISDVTKRFVAPEAPSSETPETGADAGHA